jgi:hypothetical protein
MPRPERFATKPGRRVLVTAGGSPYWLRGDAGATGAATPDEAREILSLKGGDRMNF